MIVISPAKNLNTNLESLDHKTSTPTLKLKTNKLIKILKELNLIEVKSLMKVSDSLANLNFKRIEEFDKNQNLYKPAAFLFSGDTFNGLSIRSFDNNLLNNAQKTLRILSGLYGVLKPLDLIQPYRLEMGSKINFKLGCTLPQYWTNEVTDSLNEDIKKTKSNFLYNLSSLEYFSSINSKKILAEIINFDFKKLKNHNLVNIGMAIKKLRGSMARFIISKNITKINELKGFKDDSFKFDSFDKSTKTMLFVKK
jgi:hypothetical protein